MSDRRGFLRGICALCCQQAPLQAQSQRMRRGQRRGDLVSTGLGGGGGQAGMGGLCLCLCCPGLGCTSQEGLVMLIMAIREMQIQGNPESVSRKRKSHGLVKDKKPRGCYQLPGENCA